MTPFPLFGRPNPPKTPSKRARKNPWLKNAAREADGLLNRMKESNPDVQAAIIKTATGIDIKPDKIKIDSAEDKFNSAIYEAALQDIAQDEEFKQEAKEMAMEKMRRGIPGGHRRPYNGDGEYYDGWQGFGGAFGYMDPVSMIQTVQTIREMLGGESKMMPFLTEVIRVLPSLFGKGESQPNNNNQPPRLQSPQIIAVQLADGQFIEMTRPSY